jgi:hypothetical protein
MHKEEAQYLQFHTHLLVHLSLCTQFIPIVCLMNNRETNESLFWECDAGDYPPIIEPKQLMYIDNTPGNSAPTFVTEISKAMAINPPLV